MDIISVHYNEIRSLFKTRSINNGIAFDEDSFNDAFIKCAQKFGNDIIEYVLAIKYFWTVYTNTIKASISHKKRLDFVSIDEELHDCVDDSADYNHAQNVYNIVMDAISVKYGEEQMMMYSLYKYHDWNKEDLIDAGYDCDDFDNRIKDIHKFVRSYCKKHTNELNTY